MNDAERLEMLKAGDTIRELRAENERLQEARDALTNPPMPEWNNIPEEFRCRIMDEGQREVCHCCPDAPFYLYGLIRDLLKERERRVFEATMAANSRAPREHRQLSGPSRSRVKRTHSSAAPRCSSR